MSRAKYPKQFIRFFDDQKETLLEAAISRLVPGEQFAEPLILANDHHRFLVRESLDRQKISAQRILLEPVSRNTAPAVTAAALYLSDVNPGAIMAIMPSDHAIQDASGFERQVAESAEQAAQSRIVLFGVEAEGPHPGFGYIAPGETAPGGRSCSVQSIRQFIEKPEPRRARELVEDGWLWNSGIFVVRADVLLEEMKRFHPEIVHICRTALAASREEADYVLLDGATYARCEAVSLDHAVMEQTGKAVVMPLTCGWSDVGSWPELWEMAERDAEGNVVSGEAVLEESRNCLIHSRDMLVTTLGVDDLVVAATADAVLVSRRDEVHKVGKIVSRLEADSRREHDSHVRRHCPWGYYETLSLGPRFQVKRLHVRPGGKLSMQMHEHRSEHWIVVSGTATVTCGNRKKLVRENGSIHISARDWHRLENLGGEPLELIEVQIGEYLGEDDIVRSEDLYDRAPLNGVAKQQP